MDLSLEQLLKESDRELEAPKSKKREIKKIEILWKKKCGKTCPAIKLLQKPKCYKKRASLIVIPCS